MSDLITVDLLYNVIGITGMAILVGAYTAFQFRVVERGFVFSIANLIGACLLLVSLTHKFNLPSFLMEVFFILVTCWQLATEFQRWRQRRKVFHEPVLLDKGVYLVRSPQAYAALGERYRTILGGAHQLDYPTVITVSRDSNNYLMPLQTCPVREYAQEVQRVAELLRGEG